MASRIPKVSTQIQRFSVYPKPYTRYLLSWILCLLSRAKRVIFMEILNYTDDHCQFRRGLQAFLAEEVTPFADQWEKDKIVPKSLILTLKVKVIILLGYNF